MKVVPEMGDREKDNIIIDHTTSSSCTLPHSQLIITMADKKVYRASTFAPVNIAVIKCVSFEPIQINMLELCTNQK